MNIEWKKMQDPYLEGEVANVGNMTAEVVAFKDFGKTHVVYMWKDKRYLGARGYDDKKLATEMAIEYLQGKDILNG
jgi:hypothetical protein